jgi:translocation protein SEC66
MIPVFVPFAFIGIVVGGLGIFSKIYRNRQAGKKNMGCVDATGYLTRHTAARAYEPWFPSHPERDTYITLLQQTDPAPSDVLLKAALLRRAVADVTRIFRIRDDKAALTALLQKGSISDDLWANFQAAERELEAEIVEVVTEANTFVEGWGQIIFQSAGEVVQNEKYRDIFANIPKQKTALGTYSLVIKIITRTAHHCHLVIFQMPSWVSSGPQSGLDHPPLHLRYRPYPYRTVQIPPCQLNRHPNAPNELLPPLPPLTGRQAMARRHFHPLPPPNSISNFRLLRVATLKYLISCFTVFSYH